MNANELVPITLYVARYCGSSGTGGTEGAAVLARLDAHFPGAVAVRVKSAKLCSHLHATLHKEVTIAYTYFIDDPEEEWYEFTCTVAAETVYVPRSAIPTA